MEVEVEGASGAGLELADRIAPFVAVPVAGRVIVQRRHGRVVAAGHHRDPRPVRVVAGKLRPELRLKPHVFAGNDSPGFRQQVMRIGGAGFQLLRVLGQDRQRQVMLAHHELARHQVVAGVAQLVRLRHGGVIRVAQPPLLEGHLAHGLVLRGAAEGLGQDEAEGGRQQVVEHVRAGAGVVFLDAEHRAIGAGGGMADFQSLPPEDYPISVDRIANGPVNQRDRLISARDQLLQDAGRLGDQQVAMVPDDRELPGPKTAEAAG